MCIEKLNKVNVIKQEVAEGDTAATDQNYADCSTQATWTKLWEVKSEK